MNSRLERWGASALLVVFAAITLLPFLSVFSAALQSPDARVAGLQWPHHPHWENFRLAWTTAGFGDLLRSSSIVALGVVPIAVLLAAMAGYALAVIRPPGSRLIGSFMLLGLTLPIEAVVIPLYYDLKPLGIVNTYWALILPLIGLFLPFGVFWMRTAFQSIPTSLVEAAEIDGASAWTTLWRVLLPNVRPAVVTLALLYFMWAWNQFLLALILIQDPSMRTAPAGLGFFIGSQTASSNVPLLAAATIIVFAPVVVVYVVAQRHFIQGMLEGALKG